MSKRKISVFFMVVISVIFIIMGLIQTKDYHRLKQTATEQISGEVIIVSKYESHSKNRHRTTYHIYVKFTVDKTEYTTSFTQSRSKFHEGEKVTVMYDPKNPENCYIVGVFRNEGIGTVIVGAAFLVLVIIAIIKNCKQLE